MAEENTTLCSVRMKASRSIPSGSTIAEIEVEVSEISAEEAFKVATVALARIEQSFKHLRRDGDH